MFPFWVGVVSAQSCMAHAGADLCATCGLESCWVFPGWNGLSYRKDHEHLEALELLEQRDPLR